MFNAFLTVALSRATELLSEKAALDKFLASIRNVTPDAKCIALQDQARHCKVAKAFHSHHKKLEPMIRPGSDAEEVWSKGILLMISKEKHFKQMSGIAPRGDLERRLQKFLENGELISTEEADEMSATG